jgi:predicted nucleic acid-binding protein
VPYTALLDANVLVPYTLTDILLRLSEAGFFRPLWSTEVLAETERTLAHLYPDVDSSRFHDRLAAMDLFFTDATVTGWESLLDSIELPDPDDRHVVAAAVVGGADAIITANLTDFPDSTLAAFDIVAVHPDTFLLDQWDLDPTLAAQILRDTAAARQRPEVTVADVLDQLSRSGTPRFSAQAAAELHS